MDKSLEVLNPKPWASRKHTYTSETAKTLESLSRQIMEAATARDWQNTLFTKYVAPKFIADFEHSAGQVLDSWQAYIEHHERIASQNPYYGFEVLNTAADVYELSGKAIIYVLLKGFGHPKNVQRESIMLMYWRRREGLWRCHKEKVIRGLHWLPECQVEMVAENAPADFDDDEDEDDEDVADGEKQQTTGA
ncbi:hypothetical protein CB0940_04652 [Cercospora beticola]|uniref:SnoaL-like domain-containing protein n=1 Tax=Cercospora beticola TaxID=122368 RepID=A0A2G5HN57_CERBT|nr:hypothetical protein CB0940_04652 [Cercospora beticola]PIA93965.1 hypothetical protein CB0940_04652 [Cercospora beticola]WPB01912.1 hypothetical protein RHO25_006545 [Cercospora beticola]